MPVDRIDRVMTNSRSRREEGLGDTGHSYIVGNDTLLRTEHRSYLEAPTRFVDTPASAPDYESIGEEVEAYETTILHMPIRMSFLSGDQQTGQ
jgi:methyl-accepting chemotaxis protein